MPEFKTTAKGVDAPFVKRTTENVEILGESYGVHFTKGEGDKGWIAFASADLDAPHATGKTLDGAVLALRAHMEDAANADAMGDDAPEGETADVPESGTDTDTDTDDSAVTADETGTEPEVTEVTESEAPDVPSMDGAKAAVLILSAVTNARKAYTERDAGAADVAVGACKVVAELSELARAGGADASKVARLYEYGTKVAEHYYGRTGGGDTVLTDAQRSRAWKKLNKVVRELTAA